MKQLILLILTVPMLFLGCKQNVQFAAADSTAPNPETPLGGGSGTDPVVNGPQVKIVKAPSDHKSGEQTEVVFQVIAGDHEIASVQCFVDSIEISCDWVKGVVNLFDQPLGINWFEVVATDVAGLVGQAKEKWSVYDNFTKKSDHIHVDSFNNQTDILFVIDNSSSMRYEQTQISQRFHNFINEIKDLDWHIGITTTDVQHNDLPWSDGRLDPFSNGDSFLTPSLGKQKAQELFAEHVKRTESGWDIEKGIAATYRSIERALTGRRKEDQELRKFFRANAALAVVVVSDEDESGEGGASEGNNLLKLIRDHWGSKKVFQFNSIVAYNQACLDDSAKTLGVKYENLSRKTNGLIGDVCSNNYSQLLKDLGTGVANLVRVHKLSCVPQDMNYDGKLDLLIIPKNGKKVPGFTLDKDTITFDRALKPGDYDFHYFCLDN